LFYSVFAPWRKELKTITLALCLLLGGVFAFLKFDSEPEGLRTPASIPQNYEAMSGCEKQDVLWDRIQSSIYKELPDYKKLGLPQLMGMGVQALKLKGSLHLDFAPDGWKKYLHRRAGVAKVKISPVSSKYTGVFEGADCALLRLSLTYKTAGSKPVAPGLALKVLRDQTSSANVSALVSLDGQGKDFNFFKNPMSNIVPTGKDIGQKLVHGMFSRTSKYPEELVLQHMAQINSHGKKSLSPNSPRQLFFVPGKSVKSFSSKEHDVREDFLSIPEGTVIFHIYALSDKYKIFDYSNYTPEMVSKFLSESEHIADIISASEFAASEFGDDGIFFRHQLRP
jgi:hypothetical protein